MQLWLIRRTDSVGYDEFDAFVIRAKDEESARNMAARDSGDEGSKTWRTTATCELLTNEGGPGVVLGSFCAG